METELIVGDTLVCIKGYRRRIGRKYKVLSITLTDLYLQDVITNKCANHSRHWVTKEFVRVT